MKRKSLTTKEHPGLMPVQAKNIKEHQGALGDIRRIYQPFIGWSARTKPATRKSKMIIGLAAALLLALPAQTALAHDGQPPAPHDLWNAWNWDPAILAGLALGVWGYAASWNELRRRAASQDPGAGWHPASFAAGLLALFVALISPLDTLSAALFSGHMLQHTLLIVVAPPLLVWGMPPGSFLLALSPPLRKGLTRWWHTTRWLKPAWRAVTQPWAAWALNVLALWVWHVPGLYQAALQDEALHTLEHLAFTGTSLLFWWAITRPTARSSILALFTMAVQSGLLGALMTFAPSPWYAAYAAMTGPWGLSPLEDQQLAGAIMWIPVGVVYTVAALLLLGHHLAQIERRAEERENPRANKSNEESPA